MFLSLHRSMFVCGPKASAVCRAFQGRLPGCPGSLILLVSQEKLSFFRGGNAVPGALAQSLTRLGSDTGWAHSSEKPPSPEYERQVLQGLRCDFTHFLRSILSPPNVVLERRVRQICPHLRPLRVVGFLSFMYRGTESRRHPLSCCQVARLRGRMTRCMVRQRIHVHGTILEVFVPTVPLCMAVTCLVSVLSEEYRNLDSARVDIMIGSVFCLSGSTKKMD